MQANNDLPKDKTIFITFEDFFVFIFLFFLFMNYVLKKYFREVFSNLAE